MSNNKRMNVPPWIKIVLVAIIVLLGLEYLSYPETETGVIRKSGSRLSVGVIGRAAAGDPVAATPIPSSSRAVVARTYTVRQGDWLSRVFPNTWEAICVLNDLADCGRIYPGQVLTLPEGVEAAEKSARAAKPKGRPVVKTETPKAVRAAPMVNDAGEILYRIVGTAPLKGCGKKDILTVSEEAWATLGLSEEDRVYL
ncbi:MAG: LysM domain-containing protein, partial [Candidatus Moraniibacteriota bacterium]